MKIGVKYKALRYDGIDDNFNIVYNADQEFHDTINFYRGIPISTTTALQHADFWVRDISKTRLMIQRQLHSIIDWEVLWIGQRPKKKPKISKSEEIYQIVNKIMVGEYAEKMKKDFAACYLEMKEVIKDLPVKKQIDIVFKTMGIGYTSTSVAFKDFNDRGKNLLE